MSVSRSGSTSSLDLVLIVGKDRLPVHLHASKSDSESDTNGLTVLSLTKVVKEATGIDPECQKLIYRGRTLFKDYHTDAESLQKPLDLLSIHNGDRIMVLSKPAPEKKERKKLISGSLDDLMKALDECERKTDDIFKKYQEEYDKFSPTLDIEEMQKQQRFFDRHYSVSMDVLLDVDHVEGSDDTEFRRRRKELADRLNKAMDMCEQRSVYIYRRIATRENEMKKLKQSSTADEGVEEEDVGS